MSEFFKATNDLMKSVVSTDVQRRERDVQNPIEQAFRSSDKYNPANSTSRVMGVVQDRLYTFVNKVTEASTADEAVKASEASKAQSNNDFSPESVSRRILGFVGKYMDKLQANGADQERLQSVFDQAKTAVEKGIEDATEQLGALNWLNEGVQQNIESTRVELDKGFNSLEERFFGESDSQTKALVEGMTAVQDTQYVRTSSSEIQIETRDGDKVSLNLAALQAYQSNSSQSVAATEQGTSVAMSRYESQYSEFTFEYSLEGQLDDAEREAISGLVKDLADVADTFFNGDMKAAFDKGLSLGYNTEELSGFAMELNYSESLRQSQVVSAYGNGRSANAPGQSVIKPLKELNQELEDISAKVTQQFENMKEVVSQTMQRIFEMRADMEDQKQKMTEFFDFSDRLIDNAFNKQSLLDGATVDKTAQ